MASVALVKLGIVGEDGHAHGTLEIRLLPGADAGNGSDVGSDAALPVRTFVYVGDYNLSLQLAFDRADPPVEVIASDGGIPIAEWKVWVLRGFKGFPDTGWVRKAY